MGKKSREKYPDLWMDELDDEFDFEPIEDENWDWDKPYDPNIPKPGTKYDKRRSDDEGFVKLEDFEDYVDYEQW